MATSSSSWVAANAGGDEKKGKKKAGPGGAFVRVWSEADELRILEGLAAHVKEHGKPPLRSKLPALFAGRGLDKKDFTLTEIYEKVRSLRIRYDKLLLSGATPSGPGVDNKFQLSTAIWGRAIAPASAPAPAKKKSAWGIRVPRDVEVLRRLYPHLLQTVDRIIAAGNVGDVLKRGLELIDDGTAAQLNAMAKRQRLREVKTVLNRDDVKKELIRTFIKSMD